MSIFNSYLLKCLCCCIFLSTSILVHAQKKNEKNENVFLHPKKFYAKYFPNIKITYEPSDSTYIKTFPKKEMIIATHILSPKVFANFQPRDAIQASSQFRTNINTITGFSFSYRHVTAGFALSLLPPIGDSPDLIRTRYRTATIKYKTPKYILTFKFMKIKGMTDVNGFNSINPLQPTYVPRPDISIKEYLFEGIYNFSWKKYSYLATMDYTEGQIKSRAGFLMKVGVYNQQFYGDTNLLSVRQRPYFSEFNDVTKIVGYNIKVSPGMGATLVIKKRFYASFSIFSPLNLYVNKLEDVKEHVIKEETSLQWVLDGSISIGYQTKRFFTALHYDVDGRNAAFGSYTYKSVYNYINLDLGYRFNTPLIIKKFYKDTMPPGM
jgi:hypothetical protein